MKKVIMLILISLGTLSMTAQSVKSTDFKVYGNCGMCENRIEKAALSADGVKKADWNRETEILTIEYDASLVNLDDVHKRIAKQGHDTEIHRAEDKVYQGLPSCCQYERPADDKAE